MYEFDDNKQKVIFYFEKDGTRANISDWNFIQKDILIELCDNGFAIKDDTLVEVSPENIYQLDEVERKMLGLPLEYPYDMYVSAKDATLLQDGFSYKVLFFSFYPGGNILQYDAKGCFLTVDGIKYLFSKEQYALFNAITEFNSLDKSERNKLNNLIHFAEIKGLSRSAAAKLDGYLADNDVYIPNKIKVIVDCDNDRLHLSAAIDTEDSEQFTERFDKKDRVKETYRLKKNEGKRLTVVFDDKQTAQLETIKKYDGTSERHTIEKLMESPESVFDTSKVDIHEFYSERVIEKGLYRPKYYSFISPYKSEWVYGIKVNDNVNGSKYLFIKTEDDLNRLETKIDKAREEGKMSVEWDNTILNITEILPEIEKAKAHFKKKKEARESSGEEALIIKENAETLGYSENANDTPQNVSHYIFHTCSSLNPAIRLKDHQVEGVAWLQYMYNNNYRGCLLADDMGLGKTLQILYFLEWHRQQNATKHKPYLIVAPVSLLENWKREYEKFFVGNRMQVSVVMSKDLEKELSPKTVAKLQSKDFILTNYESVRNRQFNFCAVNYAVVVLDEAQKAKTPGSLVTNSVKALKADFKIAMTGTPVENTLVDLWCIMDFSVPGLLGNARGFAKEYQNPLKNKDTDIEQLGKNLRSQLGIYFERRLKTDVAKDLPAKYIHKKGEEMSKRQQLLYQGEMNAVVKMRQEGDCPPGYMFKAISAFRRICDSPNLTDNYTKMDLNELISNSSKLLITTHILDEIKFREEKVIIFTDHKDTQRLLQYVVRCKYNINARIINGETPAAANANSQKLSRQQAVDEFQENEGFGIIIMSPLAAGMGLNITGANNVIHYSRFWNPAKEQQATDRAYRIGQQREVNVYYPMSVSKGFKTFDVVIDNLLAKKTELASATLFPTTRTEIKQQELYDSLIFDDAGKSSDSYYIDEKQMDAMDNYSFEAFIAALYKKMGYKVFLTARSSDKGIDVLALSSKSNIAIQVKHSASSVGVEGVQEAKFGSEYYSRQLGSGYCERFSPVLLTNATFAETTKNLASNMDVKLIDRTSLLEMMLKHKVNHEDVSSCELHRLDRM